MIDYKKVFEKANSDYQDYQKRAGAGNARVVALGKDFEFLAKAIVEELNKQLETKPIRKPKTFMDFTKGNEDE